MNDTLYLLPPYASIQKHKTDLEILKNEIQKNGFFKINDIKIYNAELALFFMASEVRATNRKTKEIEAINVFDYFQSFEMAYKDGERYFEANFSISKDTFYGVNAEKYISDICENFFITEHKAGFKGWFFVKENYPLAVNHSTIKDFGYYSGIVSKVEALANSAPIQFRNFIIKNHTINWIEIFENIDIEQSNVNTPKVYKVNTDADKQKYYSNASFDITVQMLTKFKKQTNLFSDKRKLEFIDSLELKRPKPVSTENKMVNQTDFHALNNYYEFITEYRKRLEESTQLYPQPKRNKIEVEESFEFIGYLNQYESEGIRFKLFNTNEIEISNEDAIRLNISPNSMQKEYSENKYFSHEGIEVFYNRLFKDSSIGEKHFIKKNIDFLNSFGTGIKSDHESIFYPLLDFFEEKAKSIDTKPPQQTETKTDILKVKQIALIHFYEGLQITRENARDIAAKHGYIAKYSGEGLFQDYISYCSTANRKGKPTPCTHKRLTNKIKLFESVVNHLSDNNKQRAIDEINILKTILENEYS